MRIEWRGDSAQVILAALEGIRRKMAECEQVSRQVRGALDEANPGSENKRLNAITAEYESVVNRLRDSMEDVEQLKAATGNMIQLFEDAEAEATRLLQGLDVGSETEESGGGATVYQGRSPRNERPAGRPGVRRPKPVIAPTGRMSALGPVPGWLAEQMERYGIL